MWLSSSKLLKIRLQVQSSHKAQILSTEMTQKGLSPTYFGPVEHESEVRLTIR
jgi:hypothetical protein